MSCWELPTFCIEISQSAAMHNGMKYFIWMAFFLHELIQYVEQIYFVHQVNYFLHKLLEYVRFFVEKPTSQLLESFFSSWTDSICLFRECLCVNYRQNQCSWMSFFLHELIQILFCKTCIAHDLLQVYHKKDLWMGILNQFIKNANIFRI